MTRETSQPTSPSSPAYLTHCGVGEVGAVPALCADCELVQEDVGLTVKEACPPDGHLQLLLVVNTGGANWAFKDHAFKGWGHIHGEAVCESGCKPGMVGDRHCEVVVGVVARLQSSQIRGGGAELEGCCVAAAQAVTDTNWGRAGGLKREI